MWLNAVSRPVRSSLKVGHPSGLPSDREVALLPDVRDPPSFPVLGDKIPRSPSSEDATLRWWVDASDSHWMRVAFQETAEAMRDGY